jgi:hypothetical protein
MNTMDRDARKQVLLTRIAFERIELRRDVARLEQAARIPNLLRAAVGAGLAPSLLKKVTSRKRGGLLSGALMATRPTAAGWARPCRCCDAIAWRPPCSAAPFRSSRNAAW